MDLDVDWLDKLLVACLLMNSLNFCIDVIILEEYGYMGNVYTCERRKIIKIIWKKIPLAHKI